MGKTLVFSLLNAVLNYDCDGYMVPYANNIQRNQYVDKYFRACIELLLILIQYQPPSTEVIAGIIESDLAGC